jgi:hypothetical protein
MGNSWNVPDEEVSCPGCGKLYGHDQTTVCKVCEECSACHPSAVCKKPELVAAETFVEGLLG